MNLIVDVVEQSLTIAFFVFAMMLLLDYGNVLTSGKVNALMQRKQRGQYLISSFLGATPGCLGAFLNVSFYVHGLISFGALAGGMIATSGDEAFVLLAMVPGQALLLFALLFLLGAVCGWTTDRIVVALKLPTGNECKLQTVHKREDCSCIDLHELPCNYSRPTLMRVAMTGTSVIIIVAVALGFIGPQGWDWKRILLLSLGAVVLFIVVTAPEHFVHDHIWRHIVRKHMWSVFLWTFAALLLVEVGVQHWNLDEFVRQHMEWVGLLAVLLAIVPESGPHMVFVVLFARGAIPFSILLANSIIQDGHGMLPLLSYSIRDSLSVKAINVVFGTAVGFAFYAANL